MASLYQEPMPGARDSPTLAGGDTSTHSTSSGAPSSARRLLAPGQPATHVLLRTMTEELGRHVLLQRRVQQLGLCLVPRENCRVGNWDLEGD